MGSASAILGPAVVTWAPALAPPLFPLPPGAPEAAMLGSVEAAILEPARVGVPEAAMLEPAVAAILEPARVGVPEAAMLDPAVAAILEPVVAAILEPVVAAILEATGAAILLLLPPPWGRAVGPGLWGRSSRRGKSGAKKVLLRRSRLQKSP